MPKHSASTSATSTSQRPAMLSAHQLLCATVLHLCPAAQFARPEGFHISYANSTDELFVSWQQPLPQPPAADAGAFNASDAAECEYGTSTTGSTATVAATTRTYVTWGVRRAVPCRACLDMLDEFKCISYPCMTHHSPLRRRSSHRTAVACVWGKSSWHVDLAYGTWHP